MIRSINESLIEKFKEIPLYEEIRVIHEQYEEEEKSGKNGRKQKEEDPKIKISTDESNDTCVVNLGIFKRVVFMAIKVFD